LSLSRLLQLQLDLGQRRNQLQTVQLFTQLDYGVRLTSDYVVLAVSECTPKTDALAAGKTDVRGFAEVKGALPDRLTMTGPLVAIGSERTSGG
jgi:hypothetical protein